VALLLSAEPSLIGNPDAIEPIITGSAVPRTSGQTCNGVPGSSIPNNTYGWGRVDALAAVDTTAADLAVSQTDAPDPAIQTVNVTYTLTVTNNGPVTANDVTLEDAMPAGSGFVSATPSQGGCSTRAPTRSAPWHAHAGTSAMITPGRPRGGAA
jgi:uncharacterized repeat protein (TIGR01451 family)